MNIPTKKLHNGFEMPVYGFGLWQVGGKRSAEYENDEREVTALKNALDLGVTHFDTAEGYAAGHSEELLGRAIKGYDREKLFLATKISGENQTYNGVYRSLNASLKRLGTDYVDLYMLHSYPAKGISIKETMRALDELVDAGKIKYIGVSNLTPRRFNEAQRYSKNKIVCNQVHYNIQFREAEISGVLEHCQKNDIMLVAWRPLQKNTLPESELITSLAQKYNKTPNQIALNWLTSQNNVVTISKTSSLEHLKENIEAVNWRMDTEDIEKIRNDFPYQESISDTYPLNYDADIPA
jgi:diketogulonate reductase-like aldo/keto reductase